MADEIIFCYINDPEDDLISSTLQSVIREMNRCIITGNLYQCNIDSSMSDYIKKILRMINECIISYNNGDFDTRVSIINKLYSIMIV